MPGSSKWSLSLRLPHQNRNMHICIYTLDTYMKIRRQFSQVLKTSSTEKRCGARSWQPKATRSQKRQETFHPVCYINWRWYSNMNWQTNLLNEKGLQTYYITGWQFFHCSIQSRYIHDMLAVRFYFYNEESVLRLKSSFYFHPHSYQPQINLQKKWMKNDNHFGIYSSKLLPSCSYTTTM
jgi:hypothetical protein